ncbi:hypothetical protein E8E12_003692 [Didymella heteroderae]|uniref:galacturonan 1,4-alpha-galacturonidase n=1 Tax=Didymella heteroderae TaxID=1769908 RepID=A0A9P5BZS9_9PLEO|nr:hypothetical protein E8E12_003692 [Didymella heteroderae]
MTTNAKTGMKRRRKTDSNSTAAAHNTHSYQFDMDPSVSTATTMMFFENFLGFFTIDGERKDIRNQLTWLERLPRLTASKSDPALILALEATATAYGAIMSSNTALTRQAHDLYGTALRAHQAILQKRGSSGDITIHMVSTSSVFWKWGGKDVNICGDLSKEGGLLNGHGEAFWKEKSMNKSLRRPLLFALDAIKRAMMSKSRTRNSPNWFGIIANSTDILISNMDLKAMSLNGTEITKSDDWDS